MSSPPKKLKINPQNSFPTHQTNQPSIELPNDLIFMCILPRLSFKSLSKFKCVSKTWQEVISNDAKFARDQSLLPSPISCGAVFLDCCGNKIEFLNTFGSPIGIDPHHKLFTHPKVECKRILASSCGLLCVQLKCDKKDSHILYVGNVATGEGHIILTTNLDERSIGLAFDPSIEPNCYKIVHPKWDLNTEDNPTVEYVFRVYSSQTRQSMLSTKTTGVIASCFRHGKPVTLKNVVYWDCYEYVISFDPWKDIASYIELPKHKTLRYHQELGTSNGCITCTRIDSGSMEVHAFDEMEKRWERKYNVNLDMVMDANPDLFKEFWHTMGRRSGRTFGKLCGAYNVTPFPYDGGDLLFFRVRTKKLEFVFSYDSKSEKMKKFCEFRRRGRYKIYKLADQRVFMYHNSMVKLPDRLKK